MNYQKIIAGLISVDGVSSADLENMILEIKEINKGDFCLPCFSLAKILKKSPQMIAQELATQVSQKYNPFSKIEAVNGYLNFFCERGKFAENVLNSVDDGLIKNKPYLNKTMCIDYGSYNLAKYLHIGHLSTTMIGESLARINEALGYKVVRINYVGDWGTPFGKMVAAYKLWGNKSEIDERGVDAIQELYIKFAKESENNPELEQLARDTFKKLEDGDKETYEIYKWFIDVTIDETRRQTELLGVKFDSWKGESAYRNCTQDVLEMLSGKGLLETSQGAKIVNLEKFNLGVCMVLKSDGTSLYATHDIATAIDRFNTYKFDKSLYVTDVAQKLHFQQFFKVLSLAGYDFADKMEHVYYGRISLPEGKIASRKGKQALIKDILEESLSNARKVILERGENSDDFDEIARKVGVGAVAYCPLKNEKIKDTVFDMKQALSFDGETSPYMQYSYARANNILDKIELKDLCGVSADYSSITDDTAFALVKLISEFSETVMQASVQSEPSIISKYLMSVCKLFNKFYHDSRVSGTSPSVMKARVELVMAIKEILKTGLNLICIETMEHM